MVDHEFSICPDGHYGMSKAFGKGLGRYYAENHAHPKRVYAHRIGYVLPPEYDYPYGSVELAVERGGSSTRARSTTDGQVRRIDLVLPPRLRRDDRYHASRRVRRLRGVPRVNDNDRRWFDLEHVRSVLGFRPADNGERGDDPPTDEGKDR